MLNSLKNNNLFISYNDDEVAKIKLFGIKTTQLETLKTELEKHVNLVLTKRG